MHYVTTEDHTNVELPNDFTVFTIRICDAFLPKLIFGERRVLDTKTFLKKRSL